MACDSIHARDAFEDAGRGALFDEGHAAGLADLVGEPAAERGADGGDGDEEEGVGVAGGEEDEMISVTPGMGRGTNEESTMETRKMPTRPKEMRRPRRWLLLWAVARRRAGGRVVDGHWVLRLAQGLEGV